MFAKQARCLSKKAFNLLVIASRNIEQHASPAVAINNKFTPVSIDVPWGKVEGKLWGSPDKQPVLAVHGWMDNAGTFDDIAPFLTKNSSILAIDLPGHGLSSWLPHGIPYTGIIYTMTLKRIIDYFGWKKVKLLGHSLGGIMCYNYTSIYPNDVQFVVSIDSLAFIADTIESFCKRHASGMTRYIEFEKKVTTDLPRYSEEVAIEKWMKGTVFRSLDVPTSKTLMIRGARRNEDGTYSFTRDPCLKIKGLEPCHTFENIQEMAKRITCPYLVVKANKTPYHDEFKYWGNIAEILKKTSQDFQVFSVDGSHHVHMMEPESVASHIVPFLEKYDA